MSPNQASINILLIPSISYIASYTKVRFILLATLYVRPLITLSGAQVHTVHVQLARSPSLMEISEQTRAAAAAAAAGLPSTNQELFDLDVMPCIDGSLFLVPMYART